MSISFHKSGAFSSHSPQDAESVKIHSFCLSRYLFVYCIELHVTNCNAFLQKEFWLPQINSASKPEYFRFYIASKITS